MIDPQLRRTTAYWLTLAFRLSVPRRDVNGLVLTADREEHLGLLDMVQNGAGALPQRLERFRGPLTALLGAEPQVSAQAFLVDRLLEAGVRVLPITDAAYPAHLARSLTPSRAPTVLNVVGDVGLLAEPGVAVSGSRKASPESLRFSRAVGRALAEAGVTVVSGLAKGVDTEAMLGALEAGGRVIGVAAEGILKNGATRRPEVREGRLAVVSQFEPTAQWRGSMAMERNQTIAGFSRALVIADCVAEGGTTNQFEVHRKLQMAIFVRRGRGEGALIADLAARPGATALLWDGGPVGLPAPLLPGGAPVAPSAPAPIACELREERGTLVVTLRVPVGTTKDAALAALAAAWPAPLAHATEPQTAPYPSEAAAPPSPDPGDQAVLDALRGAGKALSVKELGERVREPDRKLRSRLTRMCEAKRIERAPGRAVAYTLPEAAAPLLVAGSARALPPSVPDASRP